MYSLASVFRRPFFTNVRAKDLPGGSVMSTLLALSRLLSCTFLTNSPFILKYQVHRKDTSWLCTTAFLSQSNRPDVISISFLAPLFFSLTNTFFFYPNCFEFFSSCYPLNHLVSTFHYPYLLPPPPP